PVRFDLYRDLAAVRVIAHYRDGQSTPCDRFTPDHRWVCPRNPDWSYVGRMMSMIQDRPRRCVWLHPLAAGEVLEVQLPASAAAPAELVLGMGFTSYGAQAARAPVRVEVRAGDQLLHALEQPVGGRWSVHRLSL